MLIKIRAKFNDIRIKTGGTVTKAAVLNKNEHKFCKSRF